MTDREPTATGLAGGEAYGLSPGAGPDHRPWPKVTEAMHQGRSWWVHTTRPDGRPHAMPVWGVVIDRRIVFSTDPRSVKADNLAVNAAVVVHLESGDDVVIVEGTARRVSADDLPDGFVAAYEAKYGFVVDIGEPNFGFFDVCPTKAFSWDEGQFAETAVRFLF